MITAVRVVLCLIAVMSTLKSHADNTPRDSVVTVAMLGISVAALIISFKVV